MRNEYEIRGDVTAIFLKKKDGRVLETLISTSDLPKVQEFPYTWYANFFTSAGKDYVMGSIYNPSTQKQIRLSLHRYITDAPSDIFVDHIDRDPLNNTRSNLRFANRIENGQNQNNERNTLSGIRGVGWHKRIKKWQARVRLNKKLICLGYYDDLKEAEKVVIEFRLKHFAFSAADREVQHV